MRTFTVNSPQKCVFCDQAHLSKLCNKFITVPHRKLQAAKSRLCFKCLKSGHAYNSCNSSCAYCKGPHHISLCFGSRYNTDNDPSEKKHILTSKTTEKDVFLQTAKVTIVGTNGISKTVNVLFDKGSQ